MIWSGEVGEMNEWKVVIGESSEENAQVLITSNAQHMCTIWIGRPLGVNDINLKLPLFGFACSNLHMQIGSDLTFQRNPASPT